MQMIDHVHSITFLDMGTRRAFRIDALGGYVNGEPRDSMPPTFTDRVPSDHPLKGMATFLGDNYKELREEALSR